MKLLEDPLKEVTRKERRALLAASVVALIVSKTGILPGKIPSIGVDVSSSDKPALLLIFAAVIIYLLVSFVTYAVSDFIVWRKSYFGLLDKLAFEEDQRRYEAEKAGAENVIIGFHPIDKKQEAWKKRLNKSISPTSITRASVEFILPIVIGLIAFSSLLCSALHGK